jgi:histidine ammonia-lyase
LRSGPVTLTGDDLSIEDVVRVARRGARVEVSAAALELTVATRAVDLRGRSRLGAGTGVACGIARGFAAADPEEQWPDIDGLAAVISSGELLEKVAAEVGPLEPVSTTGEAVGPGEAG